jgi:predicted enzyme related to lactoylglutathione lyase
MLQNYPMYAYIPARDVARARKFYEDKVGLKPQRDMGDGVAYKLGGQTAAFLYDAGDSAGTNRASQAFWQVEDVEREVAQLRSKGVQFEHYEPKDIGGLTMKGDIAEGDGMKVAWFKDTEGNIMALVQEGSKS